MRKFWARAALFIAPDDLARYRGAWQNASTLADAHAAFDSLWDSVAKAEFSLSSRAGQPASAPGHFAARPHVAEAESGGSIEFPPGSTVRIHGMTRYPQFNGSIGITHDVNDVNHTNVHNLPEGTLPVTLSNGQLVCVKRRCLEIVEPGSGGAQLASAPGGAAQPTSSSSGAAQPASRHLAAGGSRFAKGRATPSFAESGPTTGSGLDLA